MCVPICFSHVQLCATPLAVARQDPLSMEFSGKNTGVGYHSLLQGIFPTQGWNQGLLHCKRILDHLSRSRLIFLLFHLFVKISIFVCLFFHLGYGQGSYDGVRGSVVLKHGLEVTGQPRKLARADLSRQGLLCVSLCES